MRKEISQPWTWSNPNKYLKPFFLNLYWRFRFSVFAQPYYAIRTFIFLLFNARKIAIALDDMTRLNARIESVKDDNAVIQLNKNLWFSTLDKCYPVLPNGWKWRKD